MRRKPRRPVAGRPAPRAAVRHFANERLSQRFALPASRRFTLPAPGRFALPQAPRFAPRRLVLRPPARFVPRAMPRPAVGMIVFDVHDRPAGEVGAVSPRFIRIDTASDSFWLETSMVQEIQGEQVALLCSKRQLKDHAWE
jgi:hypothetical protein